MKCLLLTHDLIFGTQAAQAARAAGYDVTTISRVGEVEGLTPKSLDGLRLVLADLTMPGLDGREVAEWFRRETETSVHLIAIGPHVQRGKLNAASEAGWRVLTRGQFHSSAAQILGELAAMPRE